VRDIVDFTCKGIGAITNARQLKILKAHMLDNCNKLLLFFKHFLEYIERAITMKAHSKITNTKTSCVNTITITTGSARLYYRYIGQNPR
jgi:hypothetical protein